MCLDARNRAGHPCCRTARRRCKSRALRNLFGGRATVSNPDDSSEQLFKLMQRDLQDGDGVIWVRYCTVNASGAVEEVTAGAAKKSELDLKEPAAWLGHQLAA